MGDMKCNNLTYTTTISDVCFSQQDLHAYLDQSSVESSQTLDGHAPTVSFDNWGTFWVATDSITDVSNEPGQYYSHTQDILKHYLGENQGVSGELAYENGLRRLLSQQVTSAVLLQNNPVQVRSEAYPLQDVLPVFYSSASEDTRVQIRQNVSPYDLSEGEAFPVLTAHQARSYQGVIQSYDFLILAEQNLRSNDLSKNISGIVDLISLADMLTEYESSNAKTLEVLNALSDEAQNNKFDEGTAKNAFEEMGALQWNGKPLFVALKEVHAQKVQEFKKAVKEFTYQGNLLRESARYELPEEFEYKVHVPYDDFESRELYLYLIGQPVVVTQDQQSYQLGEQSGLMDLTLVQNSKDRSAPDNAALVISHYRNQVLPEVIKGMSSLKPQGPLASLTAFQVEQKQSQDPLEYDALVSQWVLASPSRLRNKMNGFSSNVSSFQSQKQLTEYGVLNHPKWKALQSDLFLKTRPENLQSYYSVLGLESQTQRDLFQNKIWDVYNAAFTYCEGKASLNQLNATLAELYIQSVALQSQWSYGQGTKKDSEAIQADAKSVWEDVVSDIHEQWTQLKASFSEMDALDPSVSIRMSEVIEFTNQRLTWSTQDDIASIQVKLNSMIQVLGYAESRVALPKEKSTAFAASPSFNKFQQDLSGSLSFNKKLQQTAIDFLNGRVDEENWIKAVQNQLDYAVSVQDLEQAVQKIQESQANLEQNAPSEFHPVHEVAVANQTRKILFALDARLRFLKQFQKDQKSDFSKVVSRGLNEWSQALPVGYPLESGASSINGQKSDARFFPKTELYVSFNDLQSLLTSNATGIDGFEQDEKLYDFFTDKEAGYFPYFCFNYEVENSAGTPWVSIRDFNALTQLIVLINYWEALLQHKDQSSPSNKIILARLQTLRTKLKQVAYGDNLDDSWIVVHNGEIERVVPTAYFKKVPSYQTSNLDEGLREAYLHVHNMASYPGYLLSKEISDHSIMQMSENLSSAVYEPEPIVADLETALIHMPQVERYDDTQLMIEGFDALTAAYFYGRLIDKSQAKNPAQDKIDYNKTVWALENVSLLDLEALAHHLSSEASQTQQMPAGLSEKGQKVLGALHLSDSQKVWVWAFCLIRIKTDKTQKQALASGHSSDAMFVEYQARDVLENNLNNPSKWAQYEGFFITRFNQLQKLQGKAPYAKSGFKTEPGFEQIQLLSGAFQDRAIESSQKNQQAEFAAIEPSSPYYFLKTPQEQHLAILCVAREFGSLSDQQFREQSTPIIQSVGGKRYAQIKSAIDRLSESNKRRLVSFTQNNLKLQYKVEINDWFKSMLPALPTMKVYWTSLLSFSQNASAYIGKDGMVDVEKLVQDFDQTIARMNLGAGFKFDDKWKLIIERSVSEIISKLLPYKKSESVRRSIQVLEKLPKISFYKFNQGNSTEVKRHSRFNPNGYSIAPGALAHYDLDDLCDASFVKRMHQLNHERFSKSMSDVGRIQKVLLNVRSVIQPPYNSKKITIGNMSLVVNADHGFIFETPNRHVAASYEDPEALQLAKVCFALFQPVLKHFEGAGLFRYPVSQISNKDAMDAMQSLMARPRERQMVEQYFQHLAQGLDDADSVNYVANNFHYFKGVALVIKSDRPASIDLSYEDLEWTLNGIESLLKEKTGLNGGQTAQLIKQGEKDG